MNIKDDFILKEINEGYLVGGSIRDLYTKKCELCDRDISIKGAEKFAKKIANQFDATLITLDSENQIFRVVLKDKINYLDISELQGKTIEDDLKRRDFTINAIAYDLAQDKFIDVTGGLQDLKNGILRHIDDKNFEDDPLRILRAFRFYAVTGFEMTDELNNKTVEEDKALAKVFRNNEKPIVTMMLIFINVIVYLLSLVDYNGILNNFANYYLYVQNGEYYRLITAAFFHADLIHLLCNMYSLAIIGKEVETVLGKKKFIFVYFMSAILGSLFSGVLANYSSIGASGAIFGLLGTLVYFGYHYRLYLGNVIMTGIVPVIILNLVIGFMNPMIDNFGHIGGLIGGVFSGMIVGIEGKTSKSDTINGIIITTILIGFLLYMMLFR